MIVYVSTESHISLILSFTDRRVKASQEEQPSNNPTKIFIGRQESVNQSCQEDSSLDEFPDDLFTGEN